MVAELVIIVVLAALLVGLPVYMWKRHGWNMLSESASTLMEFVRSMMP